MKYFSCLTVSQITFRISDQDTEVKYIEKENTKGSDKGVTQEEKPMDWGATIMDKPGILAGM